MGPEPAKPRSDRRDLHPYGGTGPDSTQCHRQILDIKSKWMLHSFMNTGFPQTLEENKKKEL